MSKILATDSLGRTICQYENETPGCSCTGLREAIKASEKYRAKALEFTCKLRSRWKECNVECRIPVGSYCDDIYKEVDA